MIKKIYFVFMLTIFLLITGCNIKENKNDELVEFLIEEIISDFAELKELIINNLDNDTIKNDIKDIYDEYLEKVNSFSKVSEISKLNKEYKDKIYEQVPVNPSELDLTNLSEDSKKELLNLLDQYLYRTNLIGIPLSKSYSLNLNSTSTSTWEYFFGENGTIIQTSKEEYWRVLPFLSNEYFLKGLNLCLDKELFKNYECLNIESQIDYSKYRYYDYDLEKAKKYFRLAITELVEDNIYNPTKEDPIVLNIEIAYGQFTDLNKCEEIHSILKESIEGAFNSKEVSDERFLINVSYWKGEHFGQIYSEKLYNGKFDISFDKISGSELDFNPYKEYLLRSSNVELSNRLTVNWSHNTGVINYDCIIYNGYRYSYDEVLLAFKQA